jgi:hypothetical protein
MIITTIQGGTGIHHAMYLPIPKGAHDVHPVGEYLVVFWPETHFNVKPYVEAMRRKGYTVTVYAPTNQKGSDRD